MAGFQNKVVWITGASSGIGEALALAFAAEGAKLALSGRREGELLRVKERTKLPADKVLVLPLDLNDTSKAGAHTAEVIKYFGRIDILVNNGGVSQRSFAKDTSLDIDRRLMEVNFFGAVALTKSVLPHFLKQRSGHFVVISSISGKFGFYLRSAYSASKHALHGFFESLRMEVFNDNVKVLMVCPGKIKTNISSNAINEKGEKHGIDDNDKREVSAEECARQIIAGLKNNEEEIFIGGKELRAIWVKRFFPKLFSKLIRKQKAE